jgi:serine-type D-Ala-D-Ala carboxypeptidase/endopeptidase (penicillin-binding protein 4)
MAGGRRRWLVGAVVALAGAIVPSVGAGAQAPTALAELRAEVLQALSGSTAGVMAFRADVAGLGTISLHPTTALRPASNNKLLVAETALQQLTPGFRYETDIYASAPISGGVIHGWLGIMASGDPTLSGLNFAVWVKALRQVGLRHVTGNLLLDASAFSDEHAAPGWKPGFVPDDVGPISGFAVDENSRRQDAQFIDHPDMGNLARWRSALAAGGITVGGENIVRPFSPALPPLVAHRSAPLSEIVDNMLTYSDNFVAEMLLDELGLELRGHGDRTDGLAAVRSEASALHVRLVRDVDGSGLSYDDRESPDTLVEWLEATMSTSSGPLLKAGLPIACETGTLQYRLCWSGTRGRVEAKTGTLDGVHTLSGFTTTAAGQAVVFSILLSGTTSDTAAIDHIDEAVHVLATTRY